MQLSTLNGKQSRPVNRFGLRMLNQMGLRERVAEARGSVKMRPAEFARALGVSKAAMSLIENGTTKALKHDTALAVQRVTGYRAEWINNGTLPKKINGAAQDGAGYNVPTLTAREEMILELFRGLTPEQQRELVVETMAQVEGNTYIQQHVKAPLRTFSNEDVEAAFGKVPTPAKVRKAARQRRPGFRDDPDAE